MSIVAASNATVFGMSISEPLGCGDLVRTLIPWAVHKRSFCGSSEKGQMKEDTRQNMGTHVVHCGQ